MIFLLDDKGPLLFIDSVHSISKAKNQTTFDSRKKTEEVTNFFNFKKLKNIIDMYHKQKPVTCRIITANRVFEGIPFQLENNILYFEVNDQKLSCDISKIVNVEIIKF